ncbi:MAG: malto-oligosyltrehalose synthase [Betaproteobacteria bacterium]|nr:malto-oligosyltrehalose synthase [Betaproteobacteria bacterium]
MDMAESAALERLASLHGIALEYHDIWGKLHRASSATLVSILGAMGVPSANESAAEKEIAAEIVRRWHRVLASASVVRVEPGPAKLRLNLPAALDSETLAWRLIEESGAEHGGNFTPGALPEVERAQVEGTLHTAREFALARAPAPGYHRFAIFRGEETLGETLLVVAPATCYRPPALENGSRVWGFAVQLYSVRSERNWGIGDYTDLRALVEQCSAVGGSIVGVNPLHALFPHNPGHASPYSPSSRLFKNWLYLDVESCEDFRECEEARAFVGRAQFQSRLKALREAELVDYVRVAEAKHSVLEMIYAHFRRNHLALSTRRAREFSEFQRAQGDALLRHTLFEALQESFHRDDPGVWGWPAWPEPYRDPASAVVESFALERIDRVEFYAYLQWQAELQLGAVGRRSFELGLSVGLYEDLAVSIDRGGAEAWANRELYSQGTSVGAPPDEFNLNGQDWGLPPIVPDRLRDSAYAPFIATLRANMRHSGALRIDHVMGLARLFWVAAGGKPVAGTYVHYPFSDLLGILALESRRNRCMIVGEDLGTVPDEVRQALAEAGVLSYRLFYFERREDGEFKPPAEYPVQALVAASTHDLPTLAGWWEGRDLMLRAGAGLFPSDAVRDAQIVARAQERARLLLALQRSELLPAGATPNPVSVPQMTPELARALHIYVARSPAQAMVVQLEDVALVRDQANLPGTVDEHPNWRRRLPRVIERLAEDSDFVALAHAMARERGVPRPLRSRCPGAGVARIPRATYRLQLHRDFNFADATALVPYLAALGISHVYCSPYLRARPGSRHGYDIIDHGALNPEIGNREDFERFVAALKAHGMGQILDMVPNHMGVMGADNAWWMDVLENGQASAYADFFDIDWNAVDPEFAGKVLVPVLGDHYGLVLERAELRLAYETDAGSFAVWYHSHRFPVDPREYPRVLEGARKLLGPGALPPAAAAELESLIAAFGYLPGRENRAPEAVAERSRDKEVHKGRLAGLVRAHSPLGEALERAVRQFNGSSGERASFEALHDLLDAQAYRLAYWRVAGDEVNYRRFFDINDLAALRVESEAVFEATHRFALEFAAEGAVDGLRIDHPDGLHDPAKYFRRLQERYAQLAGLDLAQMGADARPLYVVAEKIIAGHEHLPESWRVYGTTGYRFANILNGLFVEPGARGRLDRGWRAFVGEEAMDFEQAAYAGKRAILRGALASDLTVLARRVLKIARANWRTRDFTFNTLRQALGEIAESFPVYRTYVAERPSAQDRRFIEWAVARARRRARAADASVFAFVRSVLLAEPPQDATQQTRDEYRSFAMRFQQFTAPVTAKGIEDTAFYSFNRLVSLNDVGGDPNQIGTTLAAFHGASADRAARWPHTMLATSTHDSKRSEDVRARLDVLSETTAAWRLLVRRWTRMNRSRKQVLNEGAAPSRNDEYLLYQTLLGTFPAEDLDGAALDAYRERMESYLLKAIREAKVHTSWVNADEAYESATAAFVRALLTRSDTNLFLDDLASQARNYAWFGALNSVSMALVKFASPGVPDLYQGNEILDFFLVDPDNRRPVDYGRRRALLAELESLAAEPGALRGPGVRALLQRPQDGRAKLWVITRSLGLRREHEDLFKSGDYLPVTVAGSRANHIVAFARRGRNEGLVAVAGRLFASLGLEPGAAPLGEAVWSDTVIELPFPRGSAATLTDALSGTTLHASGGKLPVSRLFACLPVALLYYSTETR